MKKILLTMAFIASLFAEDWVAKNDHLKSMNIVTYCYKGQAYYGYEVGTRRGALTPAIVDGQFVRCKIIKTDYSIFSYNDKNTVIFFIIKNGKKKILNLN